jgi:hypothetical protein
MTRALLLVLALSILFAPLKARAGSAEIMLSPTRVVMGKDVHFANVIVKNAGDAAGDFTLSLMDMKMREDGAVVPYAPGETPEYSALNFVHVAPHSLTLEPGEFKTIHLILGKAGEHLEPGEYRTHLQIRLVHANAAAQKPEEGIHVQTDVVLAVPVIVRSGNTALSIGLDQPRLLRDSKGGNSLEMYLTRTGNRSVIGDVTVRWSPPGGAFRVIKVYPGMAIYRPLARRRLIVPLDETPAGVDLSTGALDIVYAAQKEDGGGKLAETQLKLP